MIHCTCIFFYHMSLINWTNKKSQTNSLSLKNPYLWCHVKNRVLQQLHFLAVNQSCFFLFSFLIVKEEISLKHRKGSQKAAQGMYKEFTKGASQHMQKKRKRSQKLKMNHRPQETNPYPKSPYYEHKERTFHTN